MGPYTLRQEAALAEFDTSCRALALSNEWGAAHEWWVEVADKVKRLGLFNDARAIFNKYLGPREPTRRFRRTRAEILSPVQTNHLK